MVYLLQEEGVNIGRNVWLPFIFKKKKEMGSNASEDEVLQVLTGRKPHLNNDTLNRKAYEYIESLSM